jgi:hypothetical protein
LIFLIQFDSFPELRDAELREPAEFDRGVFERDLLDSTDLERLRDLLLDTDRLLDRLLDALLDIDLFDFDEDVDLDLEREFRSISADGEALFSSLVCSTIGGGVATGVAVAETGGVAVLTARFADFDNCAISFKFD